MQAGSERIQVSGGATGRPRALPQLPRCHDVNTGNVTLLGIRGALFAIQILSCSFPAVHTRSYVMCDIMQEDVIHPLEEHSWRFPKIQVKTTNSTECPLMAKITTHEGSLTLVCCHVIREK